MKKLNKDKFKNETACVDCGIDTIEIDEYYMVWNDIWPLEGRGMLCIGCLENRLGRELTREDFTDAPINEIFTYSDRLKNRLGG